MCTGIVHRVSVEGSGKGPHEWFPVTQANVAYDHVSHAFIEYGLSIDFVNEELGPSARVAVELSADSARALVKAILKALDAVEGPHSHPNQFSSATVK